MNTGCGMAGGGFPTMMGGWVRQCAVPLKKGDWRQLG